MGIRLTVISRKDEARGSATFEFTQERVLLGRNDSADVCLPHGSVSQRHATIAYEGGQYTITDHGSTNGTEVNGIVVQKGRSKVLRDGDWIGLGIFGVRFEQNVAVVAESSREKTATLARRLSAFIAEDMDGADAEPSMEIQNGDWRGRSFELTANTRLVVGRGENANIMISDAEASREHCEVTRRGDEIWVRDLGGKNPLLVNGKPVAERRIHDGDSFSVGATVFLVRDPLEGRVREAMRGADSSVPDSLPRLGLDTPIIDPALLERSSEDEPRFASLEKTYLPPSGISITDWIIYVGAFVVFAVSLLAIYFLIR